MNKSTSKGKDYTSPPSIVFSDLFRAVHAHRIFKDAKVFSDAIPKYEADIINERYSDLNTPSAEELWDFIDEHFTIPKAIESGFSSDTSISVSDHIASLWPVLSREKDEYIQGSSLVPLPHPYIVPGGRFNEIYYWDSYFTMLGLRAHGRIDMIQSMLDNFAFEISSFGHIPNGNRSYFLSRSQPPFFSLMVELLATVNGEKVLDKYLPSLLAEHAFWMRGNDQVNSKNKSAHRRVYIKEDTILNRYWDDLDTPRDEMYPDDVELSESCETAPHELYRHLRAGCESGWDFSSRWLSDNDDLSTIRAADIAPIDLNCLLYHLEHLIAKIYKIKCDKLSGRYKELAEQRKQFINDTFWDEERGFYFDFDYVNGCLLDVHSLASAFPLFFKIASQSQADKVASIIKSKLLKPGGLSTTDIDSGQQWDAPNGWAPLQYMTVIGLKNYGHIDLAKEVVSRWLSLNESVFKSTGKMMEKYNVVDLNLKAGGGEYDVQDGFGWTNGVYLAFKSMTV